MIGNYIKAAAAAVSRSTAQLMKTGQTTSYRTGDDGDLERGRNTSFTVLAENNPFGNTNRFTDELGGQTYTKNIVIDWSTYDGSTVLGYRRIISPSGPMGWNLCIDEALTISIPPYTTGWRMTNALELLNIVNYGSPRLVDYAPFSIPINKQLWTSTTNVNQTSLVVGLSTSATAQIQYIGKSAFNSFDYLACRTFTVTGTTLS